MLITIVQLETWMGDTVDAAQGQALIDGASDIVTDFVDDATTTDTWDETTTPEAVQVVVKQMVVRALRNPMGLSGERLGDYSWQANNPASAGMALSKSERRIIRQAVGKLGAGNLELEGYLPLEPIGLDSELPL